MVIRKEKLEALKIKMKELAIDENDLIEKFILGSGKGGQKLNKTASCVYLKHKPTGVEIKCQKNRSREDNRFLARKKLCEEIASKIYKKRTERQSLIEKIRRQKQKRSKRAKEKILEAKRERSNIKKGRLSPETEES